jgi:uridine kinase
LIGDKIIIREYHRNGASLVMDFIEGLHLQPPFTVSVSGESGAGKSEIAHALKEFLDKKGYRVIVLGQDDYFRLPPHSNHRKRMEDIGWVGPGEVRLDLMAEHLRELTDPAGSAALQLNKPLVYFEEDRIGSETVNGPVDVVIAEGTYTTLLDGVDVRVFIDRSFRETRKDRLARNRDQSLEEGNDAELSFLEDVLKIEHRIIREHKARADVVIPAPEN